jgi:hypothetical protein
MQIVLWILAIITTLAAGYFTWRADVRRVVPYPWLTAALRSVAMALVWFLLLAPSIHITKEEVQQPVVVVLQDESASIPASLKGDTATYRDQMNQLTRKLQEKYRVIHWGFGAGILRDSLFGYRQPATDISAALSRVQEFYGQQNLGAVIMATDGRFNQGTHPLYQELSLRAPLYTIAIGDTALPKDLRIAQVYANRTIAVNTQFEIRADIIATRSNGTTGNIQLLEGSSTLQTIPLSITSDRFDKSVAFTVKAVTPGLHHYTIQLPVAEGESNTANNRKEVFVEVVEEKKKVLILAAAPHPDVNAIQQALNSLETYQVTVSMAATMPSFNDYQVIILHGLPANGINMPPIGNKPVWYIVSATTDSRLSTGIATLNINAAAQQNIYAGVNPAFSAFTLPARMGAVMDKMPPLSVPAGNVQPGANTQTLFYQRAGNANTNAPVWIVQSGSTPQALLLGEGLWRWRLYEYRYFQHHEVVDECIRQTVAMLAANAHEHPFRVAQQKYEWSDGESISLNAYLLNPSNEQINTAEVPISIKDSAGKVQNFNFERNGNAYRLNIGIQPAGTYHYTAKTTYNGKTYTAGGSFVVTGLPLELMQTGADYPLLYALAQKYRGAVLPASRLLSVYDSVSRNDQVRPLLQSNDETLPLVDWKWYFFLVLAVLTTEWLLRKYWLAQ